MDLENAIDLNNIVSVLVKILCGVLLVFYFLITVLIYRHARLMGKAVKTKYSGIINCVAILQIVLVLGLISLLFLI